MNLFGFLKGKKPDAVTYRLIWFEIQIAPFAYRFAILPEQPILIGLEGENGEKGLTMLIRYDHAPQVFDKTVEQVDALIKQCGILGLPLTNPGLAFADAQMKTPGVHLRLAYADQTRWAGVYALDQLPAPVATFLKETKDLARLIMQQMAHETIPGEQAMEHLEPERNAAQKNSPTVIVKVRVSRMGAIGVNDREVSLPELHAILDDLKAKNGTVWYYREESDQEPSEATTRTIKQVLDAVIIRKLPVQLQTEKY